MTRFIIMERSRPRQRSGASQRSGIIINRLKKNKAQDEEKIVTVKLVM